MQPVSNLKGLCAPSLSVFLPFNVETAEGEAECGIAS